MGISQDFQVYVEIGVKKTFAGALDWPGWCRPARDEPGALQALLAYAPRYAQVLQNSGLAFRLPQDLLALRVVERLAGNSTTDFGAPAVAPAFDAQSFEQGDLERLQSILDAAWQALTGAAQAAAGKQLRLGPRGGGRDLPGILEHVTNAHRAYLSQLGWKSARTDAGTPLDGLLPARSASRDALQAAARGSLPERGPRGKVYWSPWYFARRAAWHILDHAWEIEDRVQ